MLIIMTSDGNGGDAMADPPNPSAENASPNVEGEDQNNFDPNTLKNGGEQESGATATMANTVSGNTVHNNVPGLTPSKQEGGTKKCSTSASH
jgi:hypothetical protein